MAMSISRFVYYRAMVSFLAKHSMSSMLENALPLAVANVIHSTLYYGKVPSRKSRQILGGNHHGVRVDLVGILSALLCLAISWVNTLIYMVGVRICNFPIMRMKSRKVKAPYMVKVAKMMMPRSSTTGCITDTFASMKRRCPNPLEISF